MLSDKTFLEEYRTGKNDFVDEFYKTAFDESVEYWRAVGYFRSSSLEAFGSTLQSFLKNDGKIKLITSVELTEADKNAIEEGMSRQEVSNERISQIIESEFNEGVGTGVKKLAFLLEICRLEIKIALTKVDDGIYHEKLGLFFDKGGNYVVFTGSKNDSNQALNKNYECIDVFTSWNDQSRALRKKEHFESLWNETNNELYIFKFSDALKQKIIRLSKSYGDRKAFGAGKVNEGVNNKWIHQDKAVHIFLEKERGLLNMATGTGKTRTSLKILQALYEQNKIDSIIISTYGNSLLHQWYKEILALRKSIKFRIYRHYDTFKERQQYIRNPENSILVISNENLPLVLKSISEAQGKKTLLVYDEVHRLGAPENVKALKGLSDHIRYVLGLSATPEREYDEEGNKFIQEHIGDTLMLFELKDAIQKNILAPFHYFTLDYEASEEDRANVKRVYAQKAQRAKDGNPMSNEEFWTKLAQVYKSSRVKQKVFNTFIKTRQDLLRRCIIFVDTREYALEVLDYVHQYRSDFHTYLSGDDEETLKKFAKGELECLVACHRLSEGIDIQSLNTVVLFSSDRAKLETIQRVGRCLRTDPNNPDKVANVIDFIREDSTTDEERKEWLEEVSKFRPNGEK